MTPEKFTHDYYPFALEVEKETGVPAVAIIAQAAHESGWGAASIGNNIFGIKYRKGDPGWREILTTEYSDDRDAYNGQKVKSVEFDAKLNKYRFKVYQYFADYPSPKEAFNAHARLLLNDRYKGALKHKDDPKAYLTAIWQAGYATDPNYGEKISKVVDSVIKRLPEREETFRPPMIEPIKPKLS